MKTKHFSIEEYFNDRFGVIYLFLFINLYAIFLLAVDASC